MTRTERIKETIKTLLDQMLSDCYDNESKQFFRDEILKCLEELNK